MPRSSHPHLPWARSNQSTAAEWLDTPELVRARRQFDHTAALKSTLLVSGPNSVGKNALAGRWVRALDARLFVAVSLTQATLTGSSVLATLVTKLGKAPSFRREANLQRLEVALGELDHRSLVVVLDEAQNFSHAALEELRLLLGLNLPDQPAFALVLLGDDYLLGTPQLRNHRALFSRLAGHLHLQPWSSAQHLGLGYDRERMSFELLRAGYSLDDLRRLVAYLQREIRAGRRNVGALKLSNLLQPDCFDEDLAISRVALRAPSIPNPPPPPHPSLPPDELHRRRLEGLRLLRELRQRLR